MIFDVVQPNATSGVWEKKQRYKQLTNNMKKKCRRNPVRGSKRVCVGKIWFGVVPKSLCRQNQVRGVPKKFV